MEEDVKPIYGALAVTAGFVASLGMFAVGAGTAAYFIAVEPAHKPGPSVDVADLWSATPRAVDSADQDLERLPPRVTPPRLEPTTAPVVGGQYAALPQEAVDRPADIDTATTASLPARQDQPPIEILSQHVAWCFDRYRSYRVGDDSYTPYAGGRRPCISPWSGEIAAWAEGSEPGLATGYENEPEPATDGDLEARYQNAMEDDNVLGGPIVRGAESGELLYAADDTGYGLSNDHVEYCFARYRSYRPEDNSYQPYGGGPRRQCR
jgi:hypothetical protein